MRSIKFCIVVLSTLSWTLGCENGGKEEAKSKFTGTSSAKPFDKFENNMCGEDIMQRPADWEARRDCANSGRIFLAYSDGSNKCLKVPAAKSFQCDAKSVVAKMQALADFDKELMRLYYASADEEKKFDKYEKGLDEFILDQKDKTNRAAEYILNCWEYEVEDKDFGTYSVVGMSAYLPNRKTTNEKLGCTVYSQFLDVTPCFKGLKKLKSSGLRLKKEDDPIVKDEEFKKDELIEVGKVTDEQNDDLIEYCISPD